MAGSAFAFGQSFAAGGQAWAALNGIVQAGGAATSVAGMGGWLKDMMGRPEEEEGNKEGGDKPRP